MRHRKARDRKSHHVFNTRAPTPPAQASGLPPRVRLPLDVRRLDRGIAIGARPLELLQRARARRTRDLVPTRDQGRLCGRVHAHDAPLIRRADDIRSFRRRIRGDASARTGARRRRQATDDGSGGGRRNGPSVGSRRRARARRVRRGRGGRAAFGRATLPAEALLVAQLATAQAEEDAAAALGALEAAGPIAGAALASPLELGVLRRSTALV